MIKWLEDLTDSLRLSPMTVIHGQVRDVFPLGRNDIPGPASGGYGPLELMLASRFLSLGARHILIARFGEVVFLRGSMRTAWRQAREAVDNSSANYPANEPGESRQLGDEDSSEWLTGEPINSADLINQLVGERLASRLPGLAIVFPFGIAPDLAPPLESLSTAVRPGEPVEDSLRIVLMSAREQDIPETLRYRQPFQRSFQLSLPALEERQQFFRENHRRFQPETSPPPSEADITRAAQMSEGCSRRALFDLTLLRAVVPNADLTERGFRSLRDRLLFGSQENPWAALQRNALDNAYDALSSRVIGQDDAVRAVVPILKRARLGLTDSETRPRGVFFFVGPTGVGKTELCKAMAKLIFGDTTAMIRFDMSEFRQEFTANRLIGAPPGYVGYSEGGELTRKVSERPFSLVLFDEIEKAHPRILDNFLQILDDGRLTDGQGRTVLFTNTIIVFTSNIGMRASHDQLRHRLGAEPEDPGLEGVLSPDATGRDLPADTVARTIRTQDYATITRYFRAAVRSEFVDIIKRPELLNRIGEANVLAFDFLRADADKDRIIDILIAPVATSLRERFGMELVMTRSFRAYLRQKPEGFLLNGGRGARNLLDESVINPLSDRLEAFADGGRGGKLVVDYGIPIQSLKGSDYSPAHVQIDYEP